MHLPSENVVGVLLIKATLPIPQVLRVSWLSQPILIKKVELSLVTLPGIRMQGQSMPCTFLDGDVKVGHRGVIYLSQQGLVVIVDTVTSTQQKVVLGKEELNDHRSVSHL